jgi:amino acid adenylation domain-containing protein
LQPLALSDPADAGATEIHRLRLPLEPAFLERVAAFGGARDATSFCVFAAALHALLYRRGLGSDSCLGIPLADRTDPRFEHLVGCFVNTIVLRGSVRSGDSFEQLVIRTRDASYEAIAHGGLPFELMAQQLRLSRELLSAPLYQTLFSYQNFPQGQLMIGDVEATPLTLPVLRGDIETAFRVVFEGGTCALHLDWNGWLRIPQEGLLEEWRALLEHGMRDPACTIDALAPRQEPGVPAIAPPAAPSTVPELLRARAREAPHALALIEGETRVSIGELMHGSAVVADRLRRAGVRPGMAVGLAARRSIREIVASLAIVEAGATCVPLDLAYPPERLRFMLADSGAALVLLEQADAALADSVPTLTLEGEGDAQVRSAHASALDGIGWILYTSGSSGQPKGVLISHRMVIARVLREPIPWAPDERGVHHSSPSFGDALWELVGPLAHGCPTVVAEEEEASDPRLLAGLLARRGVTRVIAVPSLLSLLLDLSPDVLARLREVRCWVATGEPLPGSIAERFRRALPEATLLNVYTATECAIVCAAHVPSGARAGERMPIGAPVPDVRVWVLDDALRPLPDGTSGELTVAGPCVSAGYLGRPRLTAARFVPCARIDGSEGLAYRTGDVGVRRADGTFEVLGRRDAQVKVGGWRVEPGEVERWLLATPGVHDGAVVPLRDAEGTATALVAYVVSEPGHVLDVEHLRAAIGQRVPAAWLPARWVPLPRLPRTPNGKLDRAVLAAHARGASPQAANGDHHVEPRTDRERVLAAIWRTLLGIERVGVTDDFFRLGGTSLLAVQMALRVERALTAEVPLRAFYAQPTIAGLIACLSA